MESDKRQFTETEKVRTFSVFIGWSLLLIANQQCGGSMEAESIALKQNETVYDGQMSTHNHALYYNISEHFLTYDFL